jgi:predicted nucleic acid-binding protein
MNEAIRAAQRLYLDSNCLIYFIERDDDLKEKIADLITYADQNKIELICSEIGVAECLYGAFKRNSEALEALYTEMFYDIALFKLCPVDGERLMLAAKLGAEIGLKLVDAVHFLAAIEKECDVFITHDDHFRSSHGVTVVPLATL